MADTGATSPGSATSTGTGDVAWSNPSNATASDGSKATSAIAAGGVPTTTYLQVTNFGFSLTSTSTVDGIEVVIERSASNTSVIKDYELFIVKGGTRSTTNRGATSTFWPTTDTTATYGSSSDLWGETWTYSDINASNSGVALRAIATAGAGFETASVDHITINVYYTDSGGGGQPMALRQSQTRQGFARVGRGF